MCNLAEENLMRSPSKTLSIEHLQDELDGATLYRTLAEVEKDPKLAEIYRRLAAVEQQHADTWSERLQKLGATIPPYRPSWRTRTLAFLARKFGTGAVIQTISGLEQIDSHQYLQTDAGAMAADERSHARLLQHITQPLKGGLEGASVARIEGRHRASSGNALRAAVLGANDGLVSNLSLIMGVAGAALSNRTILVTGLAGILAGAFSMALGEWLSVQSSRELYQRQIEIERIEISSDPEEEIEELSLIYQAKGLDAEQAKRTATRIMSDEANALETLVREELGIDPEELGGSAWEAAITSFLLFAVGAILPVLPFIFLSGTIAIIVSLLFGSIGLLLIGAGITLFTGRSVAFSGTRQVLFGLTAAAVTYLIGRIIGVNLGG